MRFFLLSLFLVGGALSFSPLAFGEDTDPLGNALDLVHQVENPTGNPPSDAQRIDLLAQAITMAQEAPNHRLKGHRVLAIQAIRSAIAEIRSGDPNHQAAIYLHTADTELSTAVALASNTDTPQVPTNAVADLLRPPSPKSVADGNVAMPPGVTPEMEQAFLAKYKAAVDKQDPDALFSLMALDPAIDPKAKEQLKAYAMLALAMDSSNPKRIYSFVPITPGQQSKPAEIDGKMYGEYLPAVIALKITYANPANPAPGTDVGATIPLGIKDHQLMLVGAKEIPGAVPPDEKSKNFGIEPNKRKIETDAEFDDSDNFASLDEFISDLKQPSVEVIASGETNLVYYAICRVRPNLCIYADGSRPGKKNYSFSIQLTDSNKVELKGEHPFVHLLEPGIDGSVFKIPSSYSGPLTFEAKYWDSLGKKQVSVSRTIDWQ